MVADYFTKPLQGSKFRKFRNFIMNRDDASIDRTIHPSHESHHKNGMQECVGKKEKCDRVDGIIGPASKHQDAGRSDGIRTSYRDALVGPEEKLKRMAPEGSIPVNPI